MSKLHYFSDIWDNLEESYNIYNSNRSCTRKEYLKMLIGYDNSKGNVILEDYLGDEVDSYSDAEYERYENLHQLFVKTYDNLRELGNREVTTFDEFFAISGGDFNLEDYSLYMKKEKASPEYVNAQGYLFDTVVMENGILHSYIINTNKDYLVFYKTDEVMDFLENADISNEHDANLYAILIHLASKNKLSMPLVIMSNKYFRLAGKSMLIGTVKHSYDEFSFDNHALKTLNGDVFAANCKMVYFRMRKGNKFCTVVGIYD